MTLGGILNGLWRGIDRNATHLLTIGGVIGLFAAVYFAIEGTGDAMCELDEVHMETYPEDMEPKTVAKIVCKHAWPAAASAAAATACIIGSDILATKRLSACNASYTCLSKNFAEYKAAAIGALGLGADKQIKEYQAKQKKDDILRDEPELPEGYYHFYDEFSRNDFVAPLEEVLDAQYAINRLLAEQGICTANDFYRLLPLEKVDRGDALMWDSNELSDYWGVVWIDFENERHDEPDGSVWYTIRFQQPPTIDGLIDWDAWITNQYINVKNVADEDLV